MIRLLLDENISPALIGKLGEQDVYAVAVPHVGLAGQPDYEIWNYALEHDFAVVTINARDFIRLLDVEIHPDSSWCEKAALRVGNNGPTFCP